jgi:hypothetical protein
MTEEPQHGSLDERKLTLEERKLDSEIEFRRLEYEAKTKESGWLAKLFTPLTTTILAGIVTVAGTVAGTLLQGRNSLQLEREKQQHELVLKMISVGDQQQAQANLRFLAESGLVSDDHLAQKILKAEAKPVLPPPPGVTVFRSTRLGCELSFASVDARGDPDAIQMLNGWESQNIIDVTIPQLTKVPSGPSSGRVRFNIRAASALKAAWAEIEEQGC